MKIFISGGAGYIGSAWAEYLLNKGHEITVLDSLVTGHRRAVDKRAVFLEMNLSEREKLISCFRNGNFEAVMHFAAFSLVGESIQNPSKYFINNDAYSINLLDAAIEGKVKSFVSSAWEWEKKHPTGYNDK